MGAATTAGWSARAAALRVMRAMRAAGVVVIAALAAGCGDDGGGPPPGPPLDAAVDPCGSGSLSVDDFFRCRSRLSCRLLDDCFATDVGIFDCDAVAHDALGTAVRDQPVVEEAIAAGRATWDPVQAAACLDQIAARGCALVKLDPDDRVTCSGVVGAVPDGAPCELASDCATPGAACTGVIIIDDGGGEARAAGGPACTTVCVAPLAVGGPCLQGGFCGPDDHCVVHVIDDDDRSQCRAGTGGSPCNRDLDCDLGLRCDGGSGGQLADGQCAPGRGPGEPCGADRHCRDELMCVGEVPNDPALPVGACTDLRAAGARCDDNARFLCFGHRYCDLSGGNLGRCAAAPSVGSLCGNRQGIPDFCGLDAVCDADRCFAPRGLGAPCQDDDFSIDTCARDLFCDEALIGGASGRCQHRQAAGAQCREDDQCVSDRCRNEVCQPLTSCRR